MTVTTAPPAAARFDIEPALRTLRAYVACALGVLPLSQTFTDRQWLVDVWASMLVVLAPAALLRLRWRPHAWHTWVGLALLTAWLTARFVPDHAVAGVFPGVGTWHDITLLFQDLHETATHDVAPVHSTHAITFTLSLVLALIAALVDLLAVVGRHGALAGLPLLVVYTVGGAIPRHPVHWLYFVAAACGFLMLLSLDARDEVRRWGRLMPRPGETRGSAVLAVSAQRIAVIAVAAAVLVPLLAPSRPTNLLANAFHKGPGGGKSAGSFGAGSTSIDPFVALKGQLNRPKPLDLFTVILDPADTTQAFYLRTNVLSKVSDKGWTPGDHGRGEVLSATTFGVAPDNQLSVHTETFTASVSISGLNGNAPIFGRPVAVSGLAGRTQWSPQDELLLNSNVSKGDTFQEAVAQPHPSVAELAAAGDAVRPELAPWLAVPSTVPQLVRNLVSRITKADPSPYNRARSISDFFTDPKNGFSYSLSTKSGDSGSDLVDFLTNKVGFCQQYAAAMGIMLRIAGVPARVVLGYTHGQPDQSGSFTVTSSDAHAWVEAYFVGLGWIPFDPTPNGGTFGGSKASLPWAPHPQATQSGASVGTSGSARATNTRRAGITGAEGVGTGPKTRQSTNVRPLVWGLLILLALGLAGLVPGLVRWLRRRARLRRGRRGDPEPLWAELSATATDLGYVWSPARTPRQVVAWLGPHSGSERRSLQGLADAVEVTRYAPDAHPSAGGQLVSQLRAVESELRSQRRWGVRIRARLLPESLAWHLPVRPRRR